MSGRLNRQGAMRLYCDGCGRLLTKNTYFGVIYDHGVTNTADNKSKTGSHHYCNECKDLWLHERERQRDRWRRGEE